MTFSALSDHHKGLLLTSVGGLALSVDIPLIRLSSGEVWSILAVRSLMTLFVSVLILVVIRSMGGSLRARLPGWTGVPAGLLYGIGTICFLAAVYYTTAANVVFILAFNPMFAALLSWIFLRERPSPSTLVTMAVMIIGVGLIVSDGMAGGHLIGNILSAVAALSIAGAITIGRAAKREMGFAPLLAAVVPAAIGLYHVLPTGFAIDHPVWILLNGGIMMPLAFWCLATGPRYLSAPEVGMFYLLETILAPVWVWMIFAETPTAMTLLGGLVLIAALAVHSIWQARAKARRNAVAA
ncbi:DMT family transporter [Rhizobium sp. RAF56]|jgi:drug/metabolite transporter (DMT)-like permease|uniref:DMT family transporter n=1 Tax=Rhizobium sp. RAF56 TaxID=3233062 RepID=UPI003F9E8F5E